MQGNICRNSGKQTLADKRAQRKYNKYEMINSSSCLSNENLTI